MDSELTEIGETLEFENDGAYIFDELSWNAGDVKLKLRVKTGIEDDPDKAWEITAVNVHKHVIITTEDNLISECSDHVLLKPFNEKGGTLYFSQLSYEPDSFLGSLQRQIREFSDGWLDLADFINYSAITVPGPSGQLASGPMSLLKCFEEEIQARGGKSKIIHVGYAREWDGSKWISTKPSPKKVLILADSYIVADDFRYEKQS